MSRKTRPARRAAFLRAVAETGNQTLACERAKVSRSWVQLHRSTDPGFDADVRAAIEEARRRFDRLSANGEGTTRPPGKWRHQDGEELVVRGSRGRRVQVARARLHQWTPRVEERFLELLKQCCNLRLALKAVGFSAASLHEHRKRWPEFSARCEDALAIGYERLETGLWHGACRLFSPGGYAAPEVPAVAPVSASDAIALLRLHEKRRWEAERGIGPGGRVWRWRRDR